MKRIIRLPIYGLIEHGPDKNFAWDMYQTDELARLRQISLSSVPSSFLPHGQAASRFQHSVGVSILAERFADRNELSDQLRNQLIAAALCHDLGSSPFSHISEVFLFQKTGATHEQATASILDQGGLREVLDRYEVDPIEVGQFINGQHPAGDIIAGSIDLDNLDNSLSLWRSLGGDPLLYHPYDLVDAFTYTEDGRLAIRTSGLREILAWRETRELLYNMMHDEPNLSASTLLYRAMEFAVAADALDPSFFRMDENQALEALRTCEVQETREITQTLLHWKHYPLVFQTVSEDEDMRIASLYEDWEARKRVADQIAAELGVPAHHIALYTGRDRGAKAIHLPFVGEDAEQCQALFGPKPSQQRQRVAVFARKGVAHAKAIPGLLDAALQDVKPASGSVHAFF